MGQIANMPRKSKRGAVPPKAVKPPIPKREIVRFAPPWESGHAGPKRVDSPEESFTPYSFDHIHEETKLRRRVFVAEFLKDFNGTQALLRMGFEFEQPHAVAARWLKEPYVQWLLDRLIREAEESALITRNQVIAALVREANATGIDVSGASRVSALSKLAKILGMEKIQVEGSLELQGGVMLVPLAQDADGWEANAMKAQNALKQAAKAS